jgi:hypothetical protein
MKTFEFESNYLEAKFREAQEFLFDKQNVYVIRYDNFDASTFDKLNSELLKMS